MQDGFLTVSVIDSATNRPIENATVNIYKNPESGERQTQIYQNLKTDWYHVRCTWPSIFSTTFRC